MKRPTTLTLSPEDTRLVRSALQSFQADIIRTADVREMRQDIARPLTDLLRTSAGRLADIIERIPA